jgi:hypothetical protein
LYVELLTQTTREGAKRLLSIYGVVSLKANLSRNPFQLFLEIFSICDCGWEGLNYAESEGDGSLSFYCNAFDVSVEDQASESSSL